MRKKQFITTSQRYLINDLKPNKEYNTAHAVCLNRNQGIKNLKL